jgi:ATP-dependent DNA ligase
MHPTQISQPFHRPGWIYEEKVDGRRMVRSRSRARCGSSAGTAATSPRSEFVTALRGLKPQTFIFDGEVAVYDRGFISRIEWLRRWPTDEPATLPVYMVFDLLELASAP